MLPVAVHSLYAVLPKMTLDAGSCAITYEEEIGGPVTTEHQYFATALQLLDQCNVLVRPASYGANTIVIACCPKWLLSVVAKGRSTQCIHYRGPIMLCLCKPLRNDCMQSVFACHRYSQYKDLNAASQHVLRRQSKLR